MTIQDYLEQALAHMGCENAEITIEEDEQTIKATIRVPEEDSGMFIGRRGETLTGLQRIVATTFRDQLGEKRISVDINEYKVRRGDAVQQMALEVAERVKESGKPETLPQLSPEERRLVHMALKDAGVVTQSEGEGIERRLTVFPEGNLDAKSK
ncbi:MAG TPA: hypothetical protein DCX25_04175 [Candidatus Pacebacteria bacterium]|nr:MAG: Single-stranded nucleic acid binding R3H domain protein [Microgenomates group bacterium GW2011_GWB1_45_17]KKU23508.1 MAG: Single-stranded nucleic acid binding R3H domain protein [Microgenomates group bacterium GW2011_GWA1_46_15]KKU24393.1 MAG: Single-stranded nucleic acid binding R3H domain protein [Microgenomates group bacterium GW2011_GWC1_46_15]HAV15499.1 hypothetical protein [Candidatus Paceibacterota bacterium]HCR10824.1 hypothetical protein [Candidatus Paceibacterota bacterium]